MRKLILFTGILLFARTIYAQNCNLNENARQYVVRGDVAIKEAKSDADFIDAAEEFKKALQYAPNCPDIYESIGACYEKSIGEKKFISDIKSYSEAIKAYKKYLELKPNLPNKEAVLNTIYELEYKREKLGEQLLPMVLVHGETGRRYYIGKTQVSSYIHTEVCGYVIVSGNVLIKRNKEMSYSEAETFIAQLNAKTGMNFRLPYKEELEEVAKMANLLLLNGVPNPYYEHYIGGDRGTSETKSIRLALDQYP